MVNYILNGTLLVMSKNKRTWDIHEYHYFVHTKNTFPAFFVIHSIRQFKYHQCDVLLPVPLEVWTLALIRTCLPIKSSVRF